MMGWESRCTFYTQDLFGMFFIGKILCIHRIYTIYNSKNSKMVQKSVKIPGKEGRYITGSILLFNIFVSIKL